MVAGSQILVESPPADEARVTRRSPRRKQESPQCRRETDTNHGAGTVLLSGGEVIN